ncbi:unnamed protein product [Notodromas monacha]|uniref:Uncharacterized protein n=1 Tax=Notodromas monacha TaxID=399045 RepID=A0A7R9BKB5_9CRUS|nr:unnamed protein product [Notodromas monacha]CAG0917064.1 unnamed protein product [Notodromas monacha]
MDRKNLYAPPSSIPDIRAGLRAGSKMGATQVQIPFSEKMAISLASGVIMAVCVMISQRLFGQMWIGVILGTLFSTKFLHSRFDQPKLAQVSEALGRFAGKRRLNRRYEGSSCWHRDSCQRGQPCV